jgi:DNA-directed RNA polymerase subunit N
MITPVRCFSCNKVIGDIYEYYIELLNKNEDNKKILDDLGLNRYCCRRHLISTVDMMNMI